ncbi:MAG: YARHG domain-containing protein [Cytophagales bacterium]|nr:MAG: YARHG domain-containing protein [Cytophagales bacterium]TAF61736.1 MAG: YARHG domain-containing protein [Cytophagales bacterium]
MKYLLSCFILLSFAFSTTSFVSITSHPLSFWQDGSDLDFPGKYPHTATRLIKASEIQSMSKDELRIMRNEIYARHGMIFKTPLMKSYFNTVRGYNPRYDDVSKMLSKIENQNIATIKSVEDKKK